MAVYTEIDDDALIGFMADYDAGEVLSFKGIAEGIENSNYLVTTSNGPFILTLYEKRVKPGDLPFFLGLMQHLAEAGVPSPVPIRARDGAALRSLAGRPAALISFLPGLWPKRPTPLHCRAVGEALALLHGAAESYGGHRANALGIDAWPPLLAAAGGAGDGAGAVTPELSDKLAAAMARLQADWPRGLPAGVIHADLFPDNVFFRGDRLSGLIDFYFACNDALAYDIAICINAWCFEPDLSFNVTKARRLLQGYQAVRPLTGDEIAALPILSAGAAMRFLATRLYDWTNTPAGALVTPKDPFEYLRRLDFHLAAKGPAAYGID